MKARSAQAESCCVYVKPKKLCNTVLTKFRSCLTDCWADPAAHLLLLKSPHGQAEFKIRR